MHRAEIQVSPQSRNGTEISAENTAAARLADRTESDLARALRGTGDKSGRPLGGIEPGVTRYSRSGGPATRLPAVPGRPLRGSHRSDRRWYRALAPRQSQGRGSLPKPAPHLTQQKTLPPPRSAPDPSGKHRRRIADPSAPPASAPAPAIPPSRAPPPSQPRRSIRCRCSSSLPRPRSQKRTSIVCSSTRFTKLTLVRFGNCACRSISAPIARQSKSKSSTGIAHCGFPTHSSVTSRGPVRQRQFETLGRDLRLSHVHLEFELQIARGATGAAS